ncbi:hypothetical protein ACU686_01555 [Yinghuangia aomiensis]
MAGPGEVFEEEEYPPVDDEFAEAAGAVVGAGRHIAFAERVQKGFEDVGGRDGLAAGAGEPCVQHAVGEVRGEPVGEQHGEAAAADADRPGHGHDAVGRQQ